MLPLAVCKSSHFPTYLSLSLLIKFYSFYSILGFIFYFPAGIFFGIAQNLYINFGCTEMYSILNLFFQEHGFFLSIYSDVLLHSSLILTPALPPRYLFLCIS